MLHLPRTPFRRSSLVLASLVLPGFAASSFGAGALDLHAQGIEAFPEIRPGSSVEGSLGEDSPRLLRNGPFQVFRFEGAGGARYVADLRSSDFDAYLVLAHAVGGITEFLEEDDDGGEGRDSRLTFTLEQSGTYLLIARSWGSSGAGSFTLALEEREAPPPVEPRPLARGVDAAGRLDPDVGLCLEDWGDEFACELWTLDVEGGELLQVSMASDELDPYLEVGMLGADGSLDVLETDDDGGEGNNALLVIRAPWDGALGIRARSFGSPRGGYTVRVDAVEPMAVQRRSLRIGDRVDGEILPGEAQLTGMDRAVQIWTVEGRAGDRLRIRMRSDDFDTVLTFGVEDDSGEFEQLAYNDDAPDDGLNSLIEITLPADGTYLILASSFGWSASGRYTLEVARDEG